MQDGQHQDGNASSRFPDFPIIDCIPQFLDRSQTEGRSQTLKAFRRWVREFSKGIK
ncbi:hypothetical protein IQ259_04330 [Fortiea sp. LEGE XX443]|uniref:hypothetical protein n=1 Tax=Fortiea sp. LEGE XX443 TaxID=1828611 RepID=UPI0018828469|nr:hypothetical protein [Fortiea sp. LEGE XX443]MBE9004273.1 hypothetical protein [Fortiea sp. LEGE XX443]